MVDLRLPPPVYAQVSALPQVYAQARADLRGPQGARKLSPILTHQFSSFHLNGVSVVLEQSSSSFVQPLPKAENRPTATLRARNKGIFVYKVPLSVFKRSCALFPEQGALRPAPCTLHPAPCTLHPAPCPLSPKLRALSPEPRAPGPEPRAPNPELRTLNSEPWTREPSKPPPDVRVWCAFHVNLW